jgi:hypothetical protein
MPLLPTQDVNTNAVDMAQGPSASRAGQAWDQVSRIGNTIQNFGSELAAKRKQSEILSYRSSNKSEFERFKADKHIELKAKYPGDPTGAASEFMEAMNSWGEDSLERAPNDDAKELWSQDFASSSNDAGIEINNWENNKRVSHQVSMIDENIYKDQQHLSMKPDPNTALNMLNNHMETFSNNRGILFSDEEISDKGKKTGAAITGSLMNGLLDNKQYGAALNIVNGKHPHSKTLLAGMQPEEISNVKAKAERLMLAQNEFNRSIYKKQISDVSASLQNGDKVNPADIQNAISKMSSLDPQEQAYSKDDLLHDVKYNELLNTIKEEGILNAQSLSTLAIPRKAGDTFNLKSRIEKEEKFKARAKEIVDQRMNKAPTFWASTDNDFKNMEMMAMDTRNPASLKQWTSNIVTKQEGDKSGNVQVMTSDMSKTFAMQLTSKNAEFSEQAFNTLQAGTKVGDKDYFNNAIGDMVKNKDIQPIHAMAMYMDDDRVRKDLMGAIKNQPDTEKAWATYTTNNKDADRVRKEMPADKEIQSLYKAIAVADQKGDRTWIANTMNETMELAYKDGIVNKNLSPDQSKERAISIIRDNFSVAHSGRSAVLIPRQYENKRSTIEDFMESSVSEENLKEMDIKYDPSYDKVNNLLNEDPQERFIKEVASKGQWITNDTQNGAYLVKQNTDGTFAPVRDGKGNRVEMKFEEMRGSGLKYSDDMRSTQRDIDKYTESAKTYAIDAIYREKAIKRMANLKRERKF